MTTRTKSIVIALAILALVSAAVYAQTTATLAISGTIATSIQVSLDGTNAGTNETYAIPAIAADGTFASADTGFDLYYMSNAPACTVTVSSANASATAFRLSNGSGAFIPYALSVGSYACTPVTSTPIAAAAAAYAWTAPAGGSDISVGNAAAVGSLPAGAYGDTVTFTITAP